MQVDSKQCCIACIYNVSWLSLVSNMFGLEPNLLVKVRLNRNTSNSPHYLLLRRFGPFRTVALPLLWAFVRRGCQPKSQPLSGQSRLYRCPASLSKPVRHDWPFQQRGWSYTISVLFHVVTSAPITMGVVLPTLWMCRCCTFPYK